MTVLTQKFTFRQQLHIDDSPELAELLQIEYKEVLPQFFRRSVLISKVRKYDVFVFELCEGNISKVKKNKFTLTQSVDICKQLLEGLQQIEKSNKCHNDLKPENVLYQISRKRALNEDHKILIKIGDFGTADRSGGTPGWTWPRFLSERKSGRSDMYSTGLLILYVMCDSRDLFYRLRDNYVQGWQPWINEFRKDPLIELVIRMMGLKLSVEQCKKRWEEISTCVEIFTQENFCMEYRIPRYCFDI